MVPFIKTMEKWNATIELEITLLLKDWLKQKGKTQKDLQTILGTSSERMPAIIDILKKEYTAGGLPKLASLLCSIEEAWSNKKINKIEGTTDPFSQLDLLLEEIQEDCSK